MVEPRINLAKRQHNATTSLHAGNCSVHSYESNSHTVWVDVREGYGDCMVDRGEREDVWAEQRTEVREDGVGRGDCAFGQRCVWVEVCG
jgi:hypothetical protein